MRKLVKAILLIILFAIFIFSGIQVCKYIIEANNNKKLNDDLIGKAVSSNIENIESEKVPIKVDFSVLQQENEDIVAWLYSNGTQINYPILQGKDNEYYVRKLPNRKYNIAGSLFMDYRNSKDFNDYNTIIYGHNMKNGTMFGTLQKYKNQKYYDEHKTIYLLTEKQNYEIELFAGYTISVNSDIYDLLEMSQGEINSVIKKSDFNSDVNVTSEDKIITLSTCAYEFEGARYVLMGVLREIN